MEIASWLGPYAGGTEYDEGRPYISAIDGPGGPIITGDHLTRDSTIGVGIGGVGGPSPTCWPSLTRAGSGHSPHEIHTKDQQVWMVLSRINWSPPKAVPPDRLCRHGRSGGTVHVVL